MSQTAETLRADDQPEAAAPTFHVKAEPCLMRDLLPGDLFNSLGEDWFAQFIPTVTESELVCIKVRSLAPLPGWQRDLPVYRLKIVQEPDPDPDLHLRLIGPIKEGTRIKLTAPASRAFEKDTLHRGAVLTVVRDHDRYEHFLKAVMPGWRGTFLVSRCSAIRQVDA